MEIRTFVPNKTERKLETISIAGTEAASAAAASASSWLFQVRVGRRFALLCFCSRVYNTDCSLRWRPFHLMLAIRVHLERSGSFLRDDGVGCMKKQCSAVQCIGWLREKLILNTKGRWWRNWMSEWEERRGRWLTWIPYKKQPSHTF